METFRSKLVISGTLPNMNDYTSAQRANKYKGAKLKADAQEKVEWCIRSQLRGVKHERVYLKYTFFEPNRKRDLDNISGFAHKVIQDALVVMGVLKDDGWSEIVGFSDSFFVDKKNPRIEVEIIEQ